MHERAELAIPPDTNLREVAARAASALGLSGEVEALGPLKEQLAFCLRELLG